MRRDGWLGAHVQTDEGQNLRAVAQPGIHACNDHNLPPTYVRCGQVLRFLSAARSFLSTQARKQVTRDARVVRSDAESDTPGAWMHARTLECYLRTRSGLGKRNCTSAAPDWPELEGEGAPICCQTPELHATGTHTHVCSGAHRHGNPLELPRQIDFCAQRLVPPGGLVRLPDAYLDLGGTPMPGLNVRVVCVVAFAPESD